LAVYGRPSEKGTTLNALQRENSWQLRAACRGPQAVVFFPPTAFERKEEKLEREARAKDICTGCSVRLECLDYAISIREPHGIWGGANEVERKNLMGQRVG